MVHITTQQTKVLQLLRQLGSIGVNSYDLTYKYSIKQAPTRISELKEMGYKIVSVHQKNRSVNYVLVYELPQSPVIVKEEAKKEQQYIYVGNRAIPVENLKPVQQGIF